MHELALCEAIADTVRRRSEGRRVTKVVVQIGYLRQVVPDAMSFAWEMLTADSGLDGAALEIEHVPAAVACRACGSLTKLELPMLLCGTCDGADVELRSGEELTLVSFEVAPAAREAER